MRDYFIRMYLPILVSIWPRDVENSLNFIMLSINLFDISTFESTMSKSHNGTYLFSFHIYPEVPALLPVFQ
jgi:hypothetical protein